MLNHSARHTQRSYPEHVERDFVTWLVLSQARPALIEILKITGLHDEAEALQGTTSYLMIAALSKHTARRARSAKRKTGALGMSSSEAAANLMYRMAQVAQRSDCDPKRIAFFSAQVCAWADFAQSGFSAAEGKDRYQSTALAEQETQLNYIVQAYDEVERAWN